MELGPVGHPEMGAAYQSNDQLFQHLRGFRETRSGGLNGAIILVHADVDPRRKEKSYDRLDALIKWLRENGYRCVRIDELLGGR